jgi:hypothetical protein
MSIGLFPIYYLDPPQILSAYVTNIPGAGSLPMQVVANSGVRSAYAISYIDTTGDWIGVYLGSSGNERLASIIGGGQVIITPVVIPAHTRVSLRSMSASAITNGSLTMSFLGQGLTMVGAS